MSREMYLSGQPDKRRPQRFVDQHGRRWSGTIEIKSGLPVGPISPLDFEPPLDVPQQFITYNELEPNNIKIDYNSWIASLERAKRKWERRLVMWAQRLYGDQAGKYIKSPTAELLAEVGPEPKPVEPVQAAAAGNRFVLGLTPIKPKWAETFFPEEDEKKVKREPGRVMAASEMEEKVEEWANQFPDEDEEKKAKAKA